MSQHGQVVRREPCSKCGSRDNVAVYETGYAKCFSLDCGFFEYRSGEGQEMTTNAVVQVGSFKGAADLTDRVVEALPARHITQETCEKWQYEKARYKGRKVQVANYYADGKWVCAKLRFADKGFLMIGDGSRAPLYGQWLWRNGGKNLVITEGEIDALSYSQVQGNRWPVVSVPNGAQSAVMTIKRELDWVESFDRVVLMFDADEPGQEAARKVAALLTPGKAHICKLPLKDANDMLRAGRIKELNDAMWGAVVYRPDGILCGTELFEETTSALPSHGFPWPYPKLNEMTRGLRTGELVTITAGSGIGKSTLCRELAYHLGVTHGQNVGYLGLEENIRKSSRCIMGIHMNTRFDLDPRGMEELSSEEQQAVREAFDATLGTGRFYFYKHFGSTQVDNLLARIRYLAKGCDCRWIVLDHLSIVVSALDEQLDERKLIDRAMTLLRMLVEETGIGLILVSHLKRPAEGKGYDEGREVRLSGLRGSASIEQLSDLVVGIERNMQSDNRVCRLRVLKSRAVGTTGPCDLLDYNGDTGRYILVDDEEGCPFEADTTSDF